MKKKLIILVGAIVVALAVSVGSYASTFLVSTTTMGATLAAERMATTTEAPPTEQPDWESLLPQTQYSLEILRPNAAGDENNIPFQYPASGEHWDKVAEATADDGATYISTQGQTNYRRDLYNIADHSVGSGDIQFVTVYFRFSGSLTGSTGNARAAIRTNGNDYEGSVVWTNGPTYVNSSYQWTVNPDTGAAWTWEEVDALQAGVSLRGKNSSSAAYCTQVYVAVGCEIQPIIDGSVPAGKLFTITPDPTYTGDLMFTVYLTNTGNARLAYRHLNIKIYVNNSLEVNQPPYYQVLSLENGVAVFNIEGGAAASYVVQVIGGGYNLTGPDTEAWGEGWSITPEFFCEVTQR